MSTSAILAFDLAVRPDELSQLNFISSIPTILSAFPQEWISSKFLPFLTKWLPPNNSKLATAILSTLGSLVQASSFEAVAPLLEVLFSAADPTRTAALSSILLSLPADPTAGSCLKRLSQSNWDAVRAAVPQLLGVLKSDEEKLGIFSLLIGGSSPFKVRCAVAQSVTGLSDGLALSVVEKLLAEASTRIRGLIPVVAAPRAFFLGSVASRLAVDHDWAVRASLASALVNVGDPIGAIKVGVALVNDGVYQVKLCAVRSLTTIIGKLDRTVEVAELETLRRVLAAIRARYQIATLKKAIIDLFITVYTRAPGEDDQDFVKELMRQEERGVQLYFLTQAVVLRASSLIMFINEELLGIVAKLAKSEFWTDRLGIVELLPDLIAITENGRLKDPFCALCLELAKDEAAPVRDAAARQIARVAEFTIIDGQLPPIIVTLKNGPFRDRQAAVILIHELYQRATREQEKALLKAELEQFLENGECPNVVSLVKSIVRLLAE
jgi:hypothetical protein